MSYTKQYNGVKNAQVELGIQCSSKTQIGRKMGASFAENCGASGSSVNKNGHWADNSRSGAYTKDVVPWECVRTLAGFPAEPNHYYIQRNILQPPDALKKLIFPSLETAMAQVKAQDRQKYKSDVSGENFLELLLHLRIVILQDAAVLMEHDIYKNHSVFKHEIFATPMFKDFAIALNQKIAVTEDPQSVQLGRVMPILQQTLTQLNRSQAMIAESVVNLEPNLTRLMNENRVRMRNDVLTDMSSIFQKCSNNLSDAVGSGAGVGWFSQ